MWEEQTLLPLTERGAFKRLIAGFCTLLLGLVTLYYGNLYIEYVTERLKDRQFGPLLFGAAFSVAVHGSQVLLLLLTWVMLGRGVGYYFTRAPLAANLVISSLGIGLNWTALPLLSPLLSYTFPLDLFTILLLVLLFQFLTLQVENWIDKGAAMLLWVYSFQSLEMLPAFPKNSQALSAFFHEMYSSNESFAIASMAGTALFLSFTAGALTSTWLLARYSIRLGQVRRLWESEQREIAAESGEGLREVSMVDMRSLVHDLKNPLAAVKGMILMLQGGDAKGRTGVTEKTEIMLKATNYMEHMIGEILHEDHHHPVRAEPFFLNLEKHILPFPWGEYVAVTVEPGAENLYFAVNEIRFMRALLNILDNAWRANRTAGTKDIALRVRSRAEFLEIEVLDNGPGYVAKDTAYQKSGWGSTGLGLAFARKTVVAHGGELLLAQRTDGVSGASVLITIPSVMPREPAK